MYNKYSQVNHNKQELYPELMCVCVCVPCVVQDEVDSLSPVLRDNPQLHEEVKGWVKDQKVQEIFMQGKTL